jgi:zinc protease
MKLFGVFLLSLFLLTGLAAHAAEVQEVTSKNGIKAWLIVDHKLPLISFSFAFRGGVEQDPPDMQGLANLTMSLLTEGAGPYDYAAFEQLLADHSIALTFNPGRDALFGTMKMLRDERETGFNLLHLALTQPRFDTKDIERERNQQLAGLRSQLGNPEWQARYAMFQQIFGTHPYASRRLGSTKTLGHIARNDIAQFAAHHMARNNLLVAVAGDITPEELAVTLEQVFGDLPLEAQNTPISEIVWPKNTAVLLTPRDGTQTALMFAIPGPRRNDPDWFAASIANYILGGGGFSSRLMQELRDKSGLTYGIDTGLSPMEHGGLLAGETATDNAKTGTAWRVIKKTMQDFYNDGVTAKEVQSAQNYLTGAMPLAMTSTDKIAGVLLELQIDRLGSDYLDHRSALIRAVTADDVNRVIKMWFNPDLVTLSMVGSLMELHPRRPAN